MYITYTAREVYWYILVKLTSLMLVNPNVCLYIHIIYIMYMLVKPKCLVVTFPTKSLWSSSHIGLDHTHDPMINHKNYHQKIVPSTVNQLQSPSLLVKPWLNRNLWESRSPLTMLISFGFSCPNHCDYSNHDFISWMSPKLLVSW